MKFSANLGFLWADRPLPEAIRAAKAAGFHAVECHWPYDTPAEATAAALTETGLPMLGLNTRRGDPSTGENGLAALPGRGEEAQAAIHEAVDYARRINARAIHVMAGNSSGPLARAAFVHNLGWACAHAPDLTILIEPLNAYNAPGYFLNSTGLAADVIREVGAANLKLMFDFYHVQILEGDVTRRFTALRHLVGHVQVASVPDRGAPDHGELDYSHVFRHLSEVGWEHAIGAEYRPVGPTEGSLNWLAKHLQPQTSQEAKA